MPMTARLPFGANAQTPHKTSYGAGFIFYMPASNSYERYEEVKFNGINDVTHNVERGRVMTGDGVG